MRLRVLCEDRKTENLVRRLCDAWGVPSRDVRVSVAPSARGAASAWVNKNYCSEVLAFRAVASFQRELALLVVIDGDNVGVRGRVRDLEEQLEVQVKRRRSVEPRGADERIAVFVPTWSVETWLLWLSGARDVHEGQSYKHDPRVVDGSVGRDRGAALAAFLRNREQGLASMEAARAEAKRLPA